MRRQKQLKPKFPVFATKENYQNMYQVTLACTYDPLIHFTKDIKNSRYLHLSINYPYVPVPPRTTTTGSA